MPAQPRRPGTRPTRAQRRSGAVSARTYSVPAPDSATVRPRRSFTAGPPPVDHTAEFGFVRKDLIRILIWAVPIIAVMVALSFVF